MGLTLWRFDEYGTKQESGHYSSRFGRRQNALLGIREPVVNTVINPFFQNTAQEWKVSFADIKQSLSVPVPVGSGAIHVTVDPEEASGLPGVPNGIYQQGQELIDTGLVFSDNYNVFASVFVRGAKGTVITIHMQEAVTDGWVQNEYHTIEHDYEWEWVSFQFTPDAPQIGTVNDDYIVGFGTDDFYVPPFQLTGAQVALTPGDNHPPFVHDENGSIRDAATTLVPTWGRTHGGGNANYTNVNFPVPDNILGSKGAISFWQYGTNGTCFMFKAGPGGSSIEDSEYLTNDIFTAKVDDDGLHVTFIYGITEGTYTFPAIVDSERWNHFLIQWNRNGISGAINGVPHVPTFISLAPAVSFTRHPELLVLMSNREDAQGDNVVGLQEQFTIYNVNFSNLEVRNLYERGDNLVTGAIGYVSLFEEPVLEVGEAIGFEGPGDYRVEVGGYAPGTSAGQPTIRFESGRDDEGPYIVQAKFPKILEPIQFQIMNTDSSMSASKKINDINRVLKRAGTGQKLVLQYSPLGSRRNLRARVTNAYLNIPANWTTPGAQIAGALTGLSIDLERDNFVGGRRVLGKIYVPTPMPSDNESEVQYGVTVLPPVEGNLPSPLTLAFRHGVDVLGESFAQSQSLMMGLRRRKSLEEALYVLSTTAMHVDDGSIATTTTDTFDGGYLSVPSADLSPTDYVSLGYWSQTTASGADKSKTEALSKLSNFGNYRMFVQAKNSGGIHRLRMSIGDGEYVADVTSEDWNLVDFGTVNFPSKGVLRPNLHCWSQPVIRLDAWMLEGSSDLDVAGVVFMPVDDGFLQTYSAETGDGITFVDATSEVSNTALIAAFSAGIFLSSTTPTELRVMSVVADGDGWKYQDGPMRLYAECMPTYTGLGDE